MIAAIDTSALLQLIWAAPLAVLTVTVAWALVVRGATRAVEARKDGATATAGLNVLLAVLGAALFITALVFGLIVMTTK
jgi:F0F1-type ATP synthase membrane subunit c/vacuolar-type H+-ATPase subunit K